MCILGTGPIEMASLTKMENNGPAAAQTQRPSGARNADLQRPDGTPVRVLVVDDEPSLAELLASVLRYEGWNVVTAGSGAEAVRTAREFRPDAVVLDIMLPDFNGLEVMRRLRAELPQVCQEQHAHLRELGPQAAHDLEAVEVGEHDVEHHRVGAELARGPHRLRAAARGDDVPAFVAQHAGQQFGQAGLVVDDEHAHRRAVRPLNVRVTRSGRLRVPPRRCSPCSSSSPISIGSVPSMHRPRCHLRFS